MENEKDMEGISGINLSPIIDGDGEMQDRSNQECAQPSLLNIAPFNGAGLQNTQDANGANDDVQKDIIINQSKSMSLMAKVAVVVLILATVTLGVVLAYKYFSTDIKSTHLQYGNSSLTINSVQTQNSNLYSINKQALESVCSETGAVTKTLQSVNGNQFEFVIPVLGMLQNFNNTSKFNETYSEWLQDFSANPRFFTDKVIEKIKVVLSQTYTIKNGQAIVDNLTLKSIVEDTLAYVQYNIAEKVFKILKWNSETVADQKAQSTTNLKAQTQTPIQTDDTPKSTDGTLKDETIQEKDKNDQRDSTVDKEDLISRVMQNTIWSIKQTAARNIQALRARGEQLTKYQEIFAKDNSISQEWQKVLIQDCKIMSNTKFKCSLQRIQKLVPDVTSETIKASNDYVVENAFKLVFQENVEKSA